MAVTAEPLFIGYKPVIFALPGHSNSSHAAEYCLNFVHTNFHSNATWKDFPTDKASVARMIVSSLQLEFKSLPALRLLKGEFGQHVFINSFHRTTNLLREITSKTNPGNVDLPGNLHDMVRIAYAIPRIIALVCIFDGFKMNLFPTDLHGQIDENFYISSLRIGGKAQQQVQDIQKIVLCEIESDAFHEAYQLGKNHMKDLSVLSDFVLSSTVSEKFGFPLPNATLRYCELNVLEFVGVGIHRIFLYKIENRVNLRPGSALSHVHQYYAEWRKRNGMRTDLLLR